MSEEMMNTVDQVSESSFADTLSEDLRSQGNLSDFKSADDLAKSYLSAQRMLGGSIRIPAQDASPEARQEFLKKLEGVEGVLTIPGQDADDETRKAFLSKLGVPNSAEDYEITLPEGVDADPEALADFKKYAHEIGLNSDQLSKLVQFDLARSQQHENLLADQVEQSEKYLKDKWGADYDNRLNGAKEMAKKYSGAHPEAMQHLEVTGALNNPAVIMMLSEMHGMTAEKTGAAVGQKSSYGMTPEMAREKIAEKRADVGFAKALHDHSHPGHSAAIKELEKLYTLANS